MGVNSLPKTVTPQRHGCDLNPRPFCARVQHAHHSATEPPHQSEFCLRMWTEKATGWGR